MTEPRKRKTQQERSADTTARLLEATLDLLHARGFYRVSTAEIAEHAGVSRGALTHHFASKEDIVVAAIERQLRSSTAVLHRMAADIRRSDRSASEIVDFIWRLMNDRLYYVTMEYMPEARHNEDFRSKILPVVKEFHKGLDAVWGELAEQSGMDAGRALVLMNATMCTIRGLIAQTTIKDDPEYFRTMLEFCKRQVAREFEPARRPERRAGTGPAEARARLRAAAGNGAGR